MGKYKPVEKPDSITHGTKSNQWLARAYINGGKAAINVPSMCSRFLPYLSDRNPHGICINAATALPRENTKPSSVIDASRELFM